MENGEYFYAQLLFKTGFKRISKKEMKIKKRKMQYRENNVKNLEFLKYV